MRPKNNPLDDFEAAVIAALEQTDDHTILAADLVRPFVTRAPRVSCIARIEQMERRGKVKTSRYAGRILVHLPNEVEE
jgi:hypothetical protein